MFFGGRGEKQKTEKEERRKKRERAKVGDNNGQATHGARKPLGPKNVGLHWHLMNINIGVTEFEIAECTIMKLSQCFQ